MVIPEEFLIDNPRVYHYTTIESFRSILKTWSLWASHYSCMNDTSELTHIHDMLKHGLQTIILDIIENSGDDFGQDIEAAGDKEKLVNEEVECFYDIICGQHMRGGVLNELLDQFVVSFCSHEKLDRYTRENGLLSQWIHYGGKAGCAIGFDTRALCNMLQEEEETYAIMANIDKVIYKNASYREDKDVDNLLNHIKSAYECWRRCGTLDVEPWIGKMLVALVDVDSRLKHEAFFGEHEIRLIITPLRECKDDKKRLKKDIMYRTIGNALSVPYIQIFGFGRKRLPITDVIIGPSREQERLGVSIKRFCENFEIVVHLSKTPLVIS